jgi:hypothetical protein
VTHTVSERNNNGQLRCRQCRARENYLNEMPTRCPVCNRRADYSPETDRWTHSDGSANAICWAEMSRVAI